MKKENLIGINRKQLINLKRKILDRGTTKEVLAANIDPVPTKAKIITGMSKVQQMNRGKKRYYKLGNEINQNDNDGAREISFPSANRLSFEPGLDLSVGFGPVLFRCKRNLCDNSIHGLPVPADSNVL